MSIRSLDNVKWEKAPEFIFEAKQRGINISGPNINRSTAAFAPVSNNIYWGFQAIKGIGSSTGEAIVRARGGTKFNDIWDFLDRVDRSKINVGNFKALAGAGAFDCMGYDREELIANAEALYNQLKTEEHARERAQAKIQIEKENEIKNKRKAELEAQLAAAKAAKKAKAELTEEQLWILSRADRLSGLREIARQCKLTGDPLSKIMTPEELEEYEENQWLRLQPVPKISEVINRWSLARSKELSISIQSLRKQKQYCGAYISVHPAQVLFPKANSMSSAVAGDYETFAGEISEVKEITTKKGQRMAFAVLEDALSRAELIFFPTIWKKMLQSGEAQTLDESIALVRGRVESTEPLKLIVDTVKVSKGEI
jgi:DNA polymerase III alpha subunit